MLHFETGKAGQLEAEISIPQSSFGSQTALIEQLEQDVNNLQNLSTLHRGEAEVSSYSGGPLIDYVSGDSRANSRVFPCTSPSYQPTIG